MKRTLYAMLCVAALVMAVVWMETVFPGVARLAAQEKAEPKITPSVVGNEMMQATSVPSYADVAAILSKYHCTVCHGGADPRAGLSLDDYKGMMKGGKHGSVIIAGDPGKSELILRLKGLSEPRMPFAGPPWLSDAEIDSIGRWIAAGAKQ